MNTVNAMRQAHLRTLATRGIEVTNSLRFRGLEVYEALDDKGLRILIFSGGVLGPSWASIGFVLERSGVRHTSLTLGRTHFMAEDTQEIRKLLREVIELSKESVREEVFIDNVGFMVSHLRKKFDARNLIAPAVILGVTVAVSIIQFSQPAAKPVVVEESLITCALDLNEMEFQLWLQDLVQNADTKIGQLFLQTDLGAVTLEVKQAIGSTQLLDGSLVCQDGRSQQLKFRTDSLQGGSLVELGERLDP